MDGPAGALDDRFVIGVGTGLFFDFKLGIVRRRPFAHVASQLAKSRSDFMSVNMTNFDRRLDDLGLRRNVQELLELGYTQLRDPAATSMVARIRDSILRLSAETSGPMKGRVAALLLGRDSVFAEAITVPRLLLLVEQVLGRGAVLSQLLGSVRSKGSPPLGMHVDNSWFPEPFPSWELTCTACWVTDEFTQEGGCAFAIPGSHLQRRHPPSEVRHNLSHAVPLEADAGSIWIWTGSLWHGNYPRTIAGDRVALHATFNRIGIQPIEDYQHLDRQWLRTQPEVIERLLGRHHLFGTTTPTSGGVDPMRAVQTYRYVHGQDGY